MLILGLRMFLSIFRHIEIAELYCNVNQDYSFTMDIEMLHAALTMLIIKTCAVQLFITCL